MSRRRLPPPELLVGGSEHFAALPDYVLDDDWFLPPVSLNGTFSNLRPAGVSARHVGNIDIVVLRLGFMLL